MLLADAITAWDIALIVVYLGACAYLGWLGYQRTKSTADYLLAGRKVHPFVMAMSYGATFISTSAIVGFGGVAAMFGMSLLWLTFANIFVGIFIAFVFLGGRTRQMGHRLDAHTFPEFLGRRFDSKLVHVIAGLVIFVFMPLYAAAVLIGGTEFLVADFNLNYQAALLIFASLTAIYVFFGGLKGVLYTDALQGSIMTIGMLFLLIWAYQAVGGVTAGHQALTNMKDQVFVGFKAMGHQGWTATPKFGWGSSQYDLWWLVFGTIVMGVGIGVLAQPQLVVRFLTVKSGRELNRAQAIGAVFILMMVGVAYVVGSLSNVYFYKQEVLKGRLVSRTTEDLILKREPGQPNKTVKCELLHLDLDNNGDADTHVIARSVDPNPKAPPLPTAEVKDLGGGMVEVRPHATSYMRGITRQGSAYMLNTDSIIPTFITRAMPRWFRIFFLLTLLSAAMSTMSSQYHTLGTAMGRDVVEQLLGAPKEGSNRTIHVVRIGIIVGLVLAVVIDYFMRGGYFIARATSIFFGLCASAFLPSFIGGLYWKRMTRSGAIASMIVGIGVTLFWVIFIKREEAGAIGLVRLITHGPNSLLNNHPNWPMVDPLLIALPLSALTAVVVSLLTRAPRQSHVARCFGTSEPEILEAVR